MNTTTITPCRDCGKPATVGTKAGTVLCAACAALWFPSHPITNLRGHVNGGRS